MGLLKLRHKRSFIRVFLLVLIPILSRVRTLFISTMLRITILVGVLALPKLSSSLVILVTIVTVERASLTITTLSVTKVIS